MDTGFPTEDATPVERASVESAGASPQDPSLRRILAVDSAANGLLGIPLLLAPERTARLLALPDPGNDFYPRVLGGVLTGIAAALMIERGRGAGGLVGLGTGGAIAINTLGGGAVAAWLATAEADRLPKRGKALLGGVAAAVLGIGVVEAWTARSPRHLAPRA